MAYLVKFKNRTLRAFKNRQAAENFALDWAADHANSQDIMELQVSFQNLLRQLKILKASKKEARYLKPA